MNNKNKLQEALCFRLDDTTFPFGERYQGKVRDCYTLDNKLILVTTDRLSAFDRVLCTVPYKGQVLNLLTDWWYDQIAHIVQNAKISIPHPNTMIVKKCRVFPVEFVMRAYMTGTTDTSLWVQYQKGLREFDGCVLPENLKKNAVLPSPLLTPTTKSDLHDEPITLDHIIEKELMTKNDLQIVSQKARDIFAFGRGVSDRKGLMLVDTKYEFGVDDDGNIVIVDEVHTPDSSRYWLKNTYEKRFSEGVEPESFDKEMLRLWMRNHANPYEDKVLPSVPEKIILQLAARYIELYERLTDKQFVYSKVTKSIADTIHENLASYLSTI